MDWVTQACKLSKFSGGDFQVIGRNASHRVGNVRLHDSHSLLGFRAFLFCTSCGYYATSTESSKSSAKELQFDCIDRFEGAGRDYYRRFVERQPPKANMSWPKNLVFGTSSMWSA
jgi:hypothetical protein